MQLSVLFVGSIGSTDIVVVMKSARNIIYEGTEHSRHSQWEVRHHTHALQEFSSIQNVPSWTFDTEAVALLNALPGHRVRHAALVHAGIGLADAVEAVCEEINVTFCQWNLQGDTCQPPVDRGLGRSGSW